MAHREFRHPLPGISRLAEQGSDPQAEGNTAALYPKADATTGYTEQFSQNSNGDVTQLTGANAASTVNPSTAVVALAPAAGSTTALTPTRDTRYEVTPAGACTLTLPALASVPTGRKVAVKKVDAISASVITIDGNGAETIDGDLTRKLAAPGRCMVFVSKGTSWSIEGPSFSREGVIDEYLMRERASQKLGIANLAWDWRDFMGSSTGYNAAVSTGTNAVANLLGGGRITSSGAGNGFYAREDLTCPFALDADTESWYACGRVKFDCTASTGYAAKNYAIAGVTGANMVASVGIYGDNSTANYTLIYWDGAANAYQTLTPTLDPFAAPLFHWIEIWRDGANLCVEFDLSGVVDTRAWNAAITTAFWRSFSWDNGSAEHVNRTITTDCVGVATARSAT